MRRSWGKEELGGGGGEGKVEKRRRSWHDDDAQHSGSFGSCRHHRHHHHPHHQNHSLHLELGAKVLLDDLKLNKNDMPKFKSKLRLNAFNS